MARSKATRTMRRLALMIGCVAAMLSSGAAAQRSQATPTRCRDLFRVSTLVRMPVETQGAVVVGRFDADARDDVAFGGFDGVRVLLADADGGFDVAAARLVGAPPVINPHAGEFTGDGRTDLVASSYDGRVFVLTGDGFGNFTPGPEQGPAQGG